MFIKTWNGFAFRTDMISFQFIMNKSSHRWCLNMAVVNMQAILELNDKLHKVLFAFSLCLKASPPFELKSYYHS